MYKILVNDALFCDSRIDELAIESPVVTLEANTAGSFEFTIPNGHPKASLITGRTDIITVERDGEILIKAVPVETAADFYGNTKVICEGELTYLNDSILRQSHKQGLTVRQLLESYINEHNSQVDDDKKFTVGQVTVQDDYITCFTNYNTTMTEIKEDLVDDLAGYIRLRYADNKKYIDYLAESPHTSDQVIELGKNLMDYESNLDSTEIATVIIPLGATQETQEVAGLDSYLTIKSVNDGKDYLVATTAAQNFGLISKTVRWDDVTTAAALKSKGQAYLNDTQFNNVTLELSAVDFGMFSDDIDSFRILDQIRVVSEHHGMDKYFMLTKQTINLNNPENDRITLGKTEKKSMSAKVIRQNDEILKKIEQVPTSTAMQAAITNATNLIKGAEGGYVVIETNDDGQPIEIKIQDSLDSPTKLWRWNQNGFGYSKDGGATYGTAMTMNGAIVANYITTGSLVAKNGKYELNMASGNVKMKDAEITGGVINIVSDTKTKDNITLHYSFTDDKAKHDYITSVKSTAMRVLGQPSYKVSPPILGFDIDAGYMSGGVWDGVTSTSYISTTRIQISTDQGTGYFSGGVSGGSDRDIKNSIEPLDKNKSSAFIYSLIPSEFRYNDGNSGRLHHGFIAQDVKESMGDDDWGVYIDGSLSDDPLKIKQLRYHEFIADIVATLQSQNERIKELEARLGDKE